MRLIERCSRSRIVVAALAACWLAASSFTYKLAVPGRKLAFPADHYSHPEFKTEWWYYTGHLDAESGRQYGYQVTFFRFGLRDRQEENAEIEPLFADLYMAHFALSDIREKKFYFFERANRGYGGKAGAATDRYSAWNEDWKVSEDGGAHVIEAGIRDKAVRLRLTPLKPPALHGDGGLSQKGEGEGRASYYYSLTRMKTEGEIEIAGRREIVRGLTWMDHEFGSNQLSEEQVGWDWFSIQLDNDTEIMLYRMRRRDGGVDPHSSGTLVRGNGATRHLKSAEYRVEVLDRWKSRESGADYPMRWRVAIPSQNISLEIDPFFPGQELITRKSTRVTYWEGAVRIRGTFQGKPVGGRGYVEMTGYAGKLKV